MSRRWQIELPFTKALTLNARQHHIVRAKQVAAIRREAAEVIALADVPALEHVTTWIEYSPKDLRRRDPINLIPMLKACEDAIVDCGIVPDDNPLYVRSAMPEIVGKNDLKRGIFWLIIEESKAPVMASLLLRMGSAETV